MRKKRKRNKKRKLYNKFKKYTVDEVLKMFTEAESQKNVVEDSRFKRKIRKIIDGKNVNMSSERYRNFLHHGTTCQHCGLKGTHFWLEQSVYQPENNSFHFNLYGIVDGKEVMLTKDHIIPKSLGGLNTLSNYQCLCIDCNGKKGNTSDK